MDTTEPSPNLTQAQRLLQELRLSFLVELPDRLDEIESLVLNLEHDQQTPQPAGSVYDELYRHIHSLKGSAGTHSVDIISLISHQFEDALIGISSEQTILPKQIDIFLRYVDLIRQSATLSQDDTADFSAIKTTLDTIRTELKQGRKLTLIVEGSHFMTRLYQDSLRSLPMEVSIIDDGLEALGWLLREKYDLVIMGAETKSLNGTALLYALRAAGGINRNIKTIMVTSREDAHFAKELQPDTLLTKNKMLSKQLHDVVATLFP